MSAPVVVTRHPALVALLRERGLIGADARVIAHASADDVRGRHVIGVLPLSLAALAASVTEVPLALGPADRGAELGIERLRAIAGEAVTYRVAAGDDLVLDSAAVGRLVEAFGAEHEAGATQTVSGRVSGSRDPAATVRLIVEGRE